MPWHNFVEGKSYDRDYVVAQLLKRVNSGGFENRSAARAWVEDIRRCPHDKLVWKPFGASFGRSPLNWRAWQTTTGKPMLPDHVVSV